MQVPVTAPSPYANPEHDPNITQKKYDEILVTLKKLKGRLPHLQKETNRLAQNGDFSENVEYSIAKGKLRGTNRRVLELESQLLLAKIIKPKKNAKVIKIGHVVDLKIDGVEKTYTILGSSEIDATKNIISYQSPLGSSLIGKNLGEKFKIELGRKTKEIEILKIYC